MSPSDVSHATLPSTRKRAFFFQPASFTFARRRFTRGRVLLVRLHRLGDSRGRRTLHEAHLALVEEIARVPELAREQPDDFPRRHRTRVRPVGGPACGTAFRTRTNFGTSALKHWEKYSRVFTVSSLSVFLLRVGEDCRGFPGASLARRRPPRSAFSLAASNSSPLFQRGISGASATRQPSQKASCTSSTAPEKSQVSRNSSDGWW